MSQINIHPEFKLKGQSFTAKADLLHYVKINLYENYDFLKELFSTKTNISVLTSGSTGKPKRINLSKQAMLQSADATGQFFKLPAKTTALHCLSSDYIAGKMMWVRAIHLGWHLEVVNPDSNPLLQTKANFDFAAMVPLQVQHSLSDLYRIQKLIIGGAAISYSLEQELKNIETTCYQTYGMTETITHIAIKKLSKSKAKEYYKSLPNISLAIDKRNCLQIEAPLLINEVVLTNDIVNLISPTEFEWLGRYDNVINSGGIKLFPEQIEAKLAAFIPNPFFIGSVQDKKLGEGLVLVIESNQALPAIEKQLLKANLSKYEIPKEIYYLADFFLTKNAKINRIKTLDLL